MKRPCRLSVLEASLLFAALILGGGPLLGPTARGQTPDAHGAGEVVASIAGVPTDPEGAVPLIPLREAARRFPALTREVSLQLEDVTVEYALNHLARRAGLDVLYDGKKIAVAKRVTLHLERVPAYEVLREILRNTGLGLKALPGGQLVLVLRPEAMMEAQGVDVSVEPVRVPAVAPTSIHPPVQTGTVAGTVIDASSGETLPGVNVVINGTSLGAATDASGQYTIPGVEAGTYTLVASFIGYDDETKQGVEVVDGETTVVDFVMQPGALGLDEVVVIGYGSERRRSLTGSVASVGSEDFQNIAAANTASLLQGKMTGVTVSSFTPQPGRDNPQIRIRGTGTFNAGQNPLVIIDGVTSSVSVFSQIPPADIENVTVLKDAASAAIYGSRAANGVILVQTKEGTRQAPRITFRSTLTRQTPIIDLNYLESWEYANIVNKWELAEGGSRLYTEEMIQKMKEGSDPDHFANTDWYSEVINPAPMQEYYLSVAGGTEATQYMVSAQYMDQSGIMEGTSAEQFSIRSNLNIDVGDKAKIGLNLFGYKERINEPAVASASGGGDNSITYIVRRFAKPTIPVKYSNGHWGSVDGFYPEWGGPIRNPVELIHLGEQYEDEYHLDANLSGELHLLENLVVKSHVAGVYNSSIWSSFSPTDKTYDAEGSVISESPVNGLSNNNHTNYKILNENTITYNRQFGKNDLTLLGGQSIEYYRHDYFYAHVEGFPNNNIHELGAGVENLAVDGWAQDYGLFSLFGRVSYDYDGRYLFQANLRYDGSSRLPAGNRFALFPSFSGGWVISSEGFMRDVDFLSFLKLRASWGRLGNQAISYYPYSQTYATGQDYIIGGELQGGAAITSLANQDIAWETTTVTDIGLDLHLFEQRLQITADYFDKTTTDILLRLPIPANQGTVSAPYQNVGEVQNRGWELAVNYHHTFGRSLDFNAGFNLSHINNEVIDLGALGDNELGGWITGNTINVEGAPIGAYYGYVAQGYFQRLEEVENHAEQFGTLAPGDIKFKDLNGDGTIDADHDRTIIGDPFPDYTFGVNFGARYKGFDLIAFFQGVTGIERFYWYNNELTSTSTFTESIKDHWSEKDRAAKFPRFGNWANNNAHSSYWLRDASYLRLKHVELGYTLPPEWTRNFSIRNLRVYAAGYNLLTFTPLEEFDPEKAANDNRNRGYPSMKNYAVGLSLRF